MIERAIKRKNYLANVIFNMFIISALCKAILSKILQNAFKGLLTRANANANANINLDNEFFIVPLQL